eukprot:1796711-Rhodomonas_salina.1
MKIRAIYYEDHEEYEAKVRGTEKCTAKCASTTTTPFQLEPVNSRQRKQRRDVSHPLHVAAPLLPTNGSLPSYACATRCPVLSWRMVLWSEFGTEVLWCYAECGTERAYGGTREYGNEQDTNVEDMQLDE